MLVSVVIPVFNEQEILPLFFSRLCEVLGADRDTDYEVIFIDDGSRDSSFRLLEEFAAGNHPFAVRVIKLARNAGAHPAILAAFNRCRGDAAIDFAADLQCPVESIPRMAAKFREGFEVVWGIRKERRDPLLTRVMAGVFYYLLRLLVKEELRMNNVETFLIGRKVIDYLNSFREKNTNVLILVKSLGFSQAEVLVERGRRLHGKSRWSLAKKIKLFLDTLLSFSYLPIRFISLLGILVSLAGFVLAAQQIIEKLAGAAKPAGWTYLVVLILVLSGIQMLMLGLLGEYLWRAMSQLSTRPEVVIDRLVGFETGEDSTGNNSAHRKDGS
ncbi:MAG: glycosyltransferase family 2 protein [Candidatus Glassbacteria bacterium]